MFVLASNHFRKWFSVNVGVWLRMENKFFGNYFQLTGCFEGFDPEMVWSENFHFKPFSDSRAQREREREPSTSTSPIYEPITPLTSPTSPITPSTSPIYELIYEPMNRSSTQSLWPTDLRLCRRPRAFMPRTDLRPRAFDLEPRTHELISLCVWFWSTHKPMSLWSLNFFFFFFGGGVGGGVLVVFLLCGGGFCVGGGGK